jgi:hypothetical protein
VERYFLWNDSVNGEEGQRRNSARLVELQLTAWKNWDSKSHVPDVHLSGKQCDGCNFRQQDEFVRKVQANKLYSVLTSWRLDLCCWHRAVSNCDSNIQPLVHDEIEYETLECSDQLQKNICFRGSYEACHSDTGSIGMQHSASLVAHGRNWVSIPLIYV